MRAETRPTSSLTSFDCQEKLVLPIGDATGALSVLLENRNGRRVLDGDVEETLALRFNGDTASSGTTTTGFDLECLGVDWGDG